MKLLLMVVGRVAVRGERLSWSGDVVTLDLPMTAERIYAHSSVRMDVGRGALKRGPLVFASRNAL
jgi:DUF1680 family protein